MAAAGIMTVFVALLVSGYGCGGVSCPLGRLVHRLLDLRLVESLLVSTPAFPLPSDPIPLPPPLLLLEPPLPLEPPPLALGLLRLATGLGSLNFR